MTATKTHRQHTRVLVRIDSHVTGAHDVSSDCVMMQTEKSVKQRGRFQLQLVPRRNYLNVIHPNDVVNIYVDPGDGVRGWVRLMFGYVDRIERAEITNPTGATSTVFSIIGSDFQKAIEQSSLYFNPFLRERLDARFNQLNLSGTSLRSSGITAHGTPADFVENFLQILLGFGQQWQLPKSYHQALKTRTSLKDLRRRRQQRSLKRLPPSLFKLLETVGIKRESIDESFDLILTKAFLNNVLSSNFSLEVFRKKQAKAAAILRGNSELLAYRAVLDATQADLPANINDLMDLTFIEALCVDGFVVSKSVWEAGSQTLAKYLYGNTNSLVNELFFDLRPVSLKGGLDDGPYSRKEDELGINVTGTEDMPAKGPAGVQYVPAVVFREYPYSTVHGFDLATITLLPGRDFDIDKFIPFAPIFAVNPNKPGRHIYNYKSELGLNGISPKVCDYPDDTKPVRHIDCVVIRNTDVRQSNLGRSDNDVWNVVSLYARNIGSLAAQYQFELTNFSPLLTPVSIQRHGLRARNETTQFANYSRGQADCSNVEGAVDNASVRRNLIRWQLLMDHWWQHNAEYLTGTIAMRAMPEIRAGYRLDWEDRNESYYVESVKNEWAFPGELSTSVQVSRGQRNDPFPSYIPPVFLRTDNSVDGTTSGNRGDTSRLGEFFPIKDTHATAGATNKAGPFSTAENELDKPRNSNRSGQAEYAYPMGPNKRGADNFPVPDRDGIGVGIDPITGRPFDV